MTVEQSRKKLQVKKVNVVGSKSNFNKGQGSSHQITNSQRQKSPEVSRNDFEQSQESRHSSPTPNSTQSNGNRNVTKAPGSSNSQTAKIHNLNRIQNSNANNVKTPSRFVGRNSKSVERSAPKCPTKVGKSKELCGNGKLNFFSDFLLKF